MFGINPNKSELRSRRHYVQIQVRECLLQFDPQSLFSSLLSKQIQANIYRTAYLPAVLHGCEGQYFTLREERRLRVFQNRVLRKIFRPKRHEVIGK
jgi:hypothetical protein